VNQGIAVYGNKGSTDQHAYVQQLRDGLNNFFITFIQVLKDRATRSMKLEPDVTAGDYLLGFMLGTRRALFEKDRESVTVTVSEVSPRSIGVLIALYERAVGFYGSLVNVNAYHQPGVEAGKKAAASVLDLQGKVLAKLRESKGNGRTADELAAEVGAPEEAETVFMVLEHLAANSDHGVHREEAKTIYESRYRIS
jgi:glucose-6-phosphate isomerase